MFQGVFTHGDGTVGRNLSVENSHFQCIQCRSGISVGESRNDVKKFFSHVNGAVSESPFVMEGAGEHFSQIVLGQFFENKYFAPGQKGGVNLKRRVFRRGADEGNTALFHIGEKGVLLGFVKTMYFIHKTEGSDPIGPVSLCLLHNFLDFFYTAGDGAEIHEIGVDAIGYDFSQGGFAHAGRAPENHRGNHVIFQHPPQNHAFSQQVFLANIVFQTLRPHPVCQRRHAAGVGGVVLYVKQ